MTIQAKADKAAEELRTEDNDHFKVKTWEEAKELVDAGVAPEQVIITGNDWRKMADEIPKDLDYSGPYSKIQMLPDEDVAAYLEKHSGR